MRARFAVDFDGTLVEDDTYPEIGDWLPGAADAVRALERIGNVVIFSCRTAPSHHVTEEPRGQDAVDQEVARIRAKLAEEGLEHLEVWTKPWKPPAAAYIDNKGVHFDGDWSATLERVLDLICPLHVIDLSRPIELESAVYDSSWPLHVIDLSRPIELESAVYDSSWEPDRHPSSAQFVDRVKGWIGLHDQKQADYGSDVDPFANVRSGAKKMGLPGWVGAVIRMNDKMERLNKAAKQYIEYGEISLANEGVLDSFDDMGVYSGIGATLFEEEA